MAHGRSARRHVERNEMRDELLATVNDEHATVEAFASLLAYEEKALTTAARGGRAAAACTAANNLTGWLSGATCTTSTNYTCSYDSTMYCIQVTLTYPYAANPLVPAVALFDAVLPTTLTSRATVQINPTNII